MNQFDLRSKTLIFITVFLYVNFFVSAQDTCVVKSIYGIQTGTLGVWVHNERQFSNTIALRFEVGFDAGFYGDPVKGKNYYELVPVINFEPRWYYSFKRRIRKAKPTTDNSVSFLALKTDYHSVEYIISNDPFPPISNQGSIILKCGFRKVVKSHLAYELGFGGGYRYFPKPTRLITNREHVAIDLHLRIGFSFKIKRGIRR